MKWIPPFGSSDPNAQYVNAQPTIAGSNPDAKFFNTILNELLAVIRAADMTPTDTNLHQISDAIVYLADRAATSGVTKGSYWFGKTTANFTVPSPTAVGQTYIDFTNLKTYISNNGTTWTQSGTFVPPSDIDFTILITSKFWDITEQDGQQGGEAKYNHTDNEWIYWPKIISFQDAALAGTPTTPTVTPISDDSTKIANTKFIHNVLNAIYPVGAIYIGTQSTCPMAELMPGTTWTAIQGRYLLASGTLAGTSEEYSATNTVPSGIPTAGGVFNAIDYTGATAGGFQIDNTYRSQGWDGKASGGRAISFDTSRSNSVFGQSDAVRAPGYVVNVWRRTA